MSVSAASPLPLITPAATVANDEALQRRRLLQDNSTCSNISYYDDPHETGVGDFPGSALNEYIYVQSSNNYRNGNYIPLSSRDDGATESFSQQHISQSPSNGNVIVKTTGVMSPPPLMHTMNPIATMSPILEEEDIIDFPSDHSSLSESEPEFAPVLIDREYALLLMDTDTAIENDRRQDIGARGGGENTNCMRRWSARSQLNAWKALRYCPLISRNWNLNYLLAIAVFLTVATAIYLTRDYTKHVLFWIDKQNPWVIFSIQLSLFIVVSFPVMIGYFVLIIATGYFFGFFLGYLTVIVCANIGIAIAHFTIKHFKHRIPLHRIIKNETGRAILRVISGPRAFRVVLFTRLTPIPFGIQNAIFGVSSINPRVYHLATFIGLLPAQTINVYLGSTLRSMHEVLNNRSAAWTGYISFGVEIVCGVGLMFWVVQKARKELTQALNADVNSDGKLIDIEV